MGCAAEELSWFRQLGQLAESAASRVKLDKVVRRTSTDSEKPEWRSFDLADVMEQGMAKEVTTSFITPPPEEEIALQFEVERSPDCSEHVLRSKEGEPLLVARGAATGRLIHIYVPSGGDPPAVIGPAFTLDGEDVGDGGTVWTLTAQSCECCAYAPQARACLCGKPCGRVLAEVHHTREDIGQGSVMCMTVDLPALRADGTPAVWCTRNGGAAAADASGKLCLQSRKPRWSQRLGSLTLDFYGRCTKASAKNFQLDVAGSSGRRREADLLYGKIKDNLFVLDYRYPLGMVQAFAITLTTKGWQ